MHMNSMQPAYLPGDQSEFGRVIDGQTDLGTIISELNAVGARSMELTTGPEQLAGLHLGAVPRHGIRDALIEAGISVVALAPGIELRSQHPDEGVVADIDEHVKLAADVGAARVKLLVGNGTPSAAHLPDTPAAADTAPTPALPGGPGPHYWVSQRLSAVLPRAAELGVRLVVENSGTAASAAVLFSILDAARITTAEAGQIPVAGAVWNVKASVASGETLADSAKLLFPFLTADNGYIRCESGESATALIRALPELAQVPLIIGDGQRAQA